MSGTYPASPVPQSVSYRSVSPTLRSTTHSGRIQTRSVVGHTWLFTVNYPPMSRADFETIFAFLMDQDGGAETFFFVLPDNARQVSTGGTPLVDGAHTAGDKTIQIDGWPNNVKIAAVGDFIRFSGYAKLYKNTSDATSDFAGLATHNIAPALVEDIPNNTAVDNSSQRFTVSLANDVLSTSQNHCSKYGLSVDLIENP